MARKIATLVVAGVASLSLVAEPAVAHTFSESTSLSVNRTLTKRRAIIFGSLTDGQCKARQTIELVNAKTGAIKRTDVTDNNGEYGFKVRRGKKTKKFFARFPGSVETSYEHSHTCQASQSGIVKVKRRRPNN